MKYSDNQYIVQTGLYYPEILSDVKKSTDPLQPIYESFTNAIEAIRDMQKNYPDCEGQISISIFVTPTLVDTPQSTDYSFLKLSIIDNGIGFNDEQFSRFNNFRDTRKNYNNRGSGRIQYIHYFKETSIKSIFEENGQYSERELLLSKSKLFLDQNSIVKHIKTAKTENIKNGTEVIFKNLLENNKIYDELNQETLKDKLIKKYLHYFCCNKDKIPEIKIQFYVDDSFKAESTISSDDIPEHDQTEIVEINYSKKTNGKIAKSDDKESFTISAFKISKDRLNKNKLNLVSKGEIVEESKVDLDSLTESDHINGFRYLFLLSGDYIDEKVTYDRSDLNIISKDDFIKNDLFSVQEILVEDIQESVNNSIHKMYPEIEEVKQKHQVGFARLKEMFLLDNETTKNISVSINDSESKILEKFYQAEAKKTALLDASIKESIDRVENLDTTNQNYQEDLKKAADELVKAIPLQNKRTLTHYVARRKLVLELFQKILNNETNKLKSGGRIDEDVLHNLIFQQSSNDPISSDLWLVNEEYIYFRGVSEGLLGQIEIDGAKILKEVLTEEEQDYRKKQGGDAKLKRTDILLFPAEAKCIIIELKAPGENISEHLNQINRYASLINNLSIDALKFNTFYGYLIGESIDPDDVIDNDSDFINAPNLGYIFRPYKRITGKFGRADGSLYTEIIKYSTLLERAKLRNKIFIDKLCI